MHRILLMRHVAPQLPGRQDLLDLQAQSDHTRASLLMICAQAPQRPLACICQTSKLAQILYYSYSNNLLYQTLLSVTYRMQLANKHQTLQHLQVE